MDDKMNPKQEETYYNQENINSLEGQHSVSNNYRFVNTYIEKIKNYIFHDKHE